VRTLQSRRGVKGKEKRRKVRGILEGNRTEKKKKDSTGKIRTLRGEVGRFPYFDANEEEGKREKKGHTDKGKLLQ